MGYPDLTADNREEILDRMDRYMEIFQESGLDRLSVEE